MHKDNDPHPVLSSEAAFQSHLPPHHPYNFCTPVDPTRKSSPFLSTFSDPPILQWTGDGGCLGPSDSPSCPPERQWGERSTHLGPAEGISGWGTNHTPYLHCSPALPHHNKGGRYRTQNQRPVPSAPWPNHNGSPSTDLSQAPAKATSVTMTREKEVSSTVQAGRRSLSGGTSGDQEKKCFLTPGLPDHPPLLPQLWELRAHPPSAQRGETHR